MLMVTVPADGIRAGWPAGSTAGRDGFAWLTSVLKVLLNGELHWSVARGGHNLAIDQTGYVSPMTLSRAGRLPPAPVFSIASLPVVKLRSVVVSSRM